MVQGSRFEHLSSSKSTKSENDRTDWESERVDVGGMDYDSHRSDGRGASPAPAGRAGDPR